MIEAYTAKKITKIWDEKNGYECFLKTWIFLCKALKNFKITPNSLVDKLEKVKISQQVIGKIDKKTHSDISNIKSQRDLTTLEILDVALVWQLKDTTLIILEELDKLIEKAKALALKYKDILYINRSSKNCSEIYSFGLKFLYLYRDLIEEKNLLKNFFNYILNSNISDTTKKPFYFLPQIKKIYEKRGINYIDVFASIDSKIYFAYYLSTLVFIGLRLERFIEEIKNFYKEEISEINELYYKRENLYYMQQYKNVLMISEKLCKFLKILRFKNIDFLDKKDFLYSYVRNNTIILAYILKKIQEVIVNLKVYKENILKNTKLNRNLIYSQKLLVVLISKGISKIKAYQIIQDISLKVINYGLDFKEEVLKDLRIKKFLTNNQVENIFNSYSYLQNIEQIYSSFGF